MFRLGLNTEHPHLKCCYFKKLLGHTRAGFRATCAHSEGAAQPSEWHEALNPFPTAVFNCV